MVDFNNSARHHKALAFFGAHAAIADKNGARNLQPNEVAALLKANEPVVICSRFDLPPHASRVPEKWLEVMELWAFVHPATHCVPSTKGLATFLSRSTPDSAQAAACFLFESIDILLAALREVSAPEARAIAEMMAQHGWVWGAAVLRALPAAEAARAGAPPRTPPSANQFVRLLGTLPRWRIVKTEKKPPEKTKLPPPSAEQANAILRQTLMEGAQAGERRIGQVDYMNRVTDLFFSEQPRVLLAQADTGIGKTLGYLVPAFLAAKQKKESVWIMTYTRALQTQIERESKRLPNHKTAVRKGRENYLCLLNFDHALQANRQPILAGLVARWIKASQDGDIRSGDFPSWLAGKPAQNQWLQQTTDRSENCIHAACPHYRSCFVERQRIEALDADIVIANHALVMSNALFSSQDAEPVHYIFDEGHHLFSVADSAFSFRLTGQFMARLRFWLLGTASGATSGALQSAGRFSEQGLRARISSLLEQQPHVVELLAAVEQRAKFLPQTGWRERVGAGQPLSVSENFLHEICQAVMAAQTKKDEGYDLESEPIVLSAAPTLKTHLDELQQALEKLLSALQVIEDSILTSVVRVMSSWVKNELPVLSKMCARLIAQGELVQWVDRFVIERIEGRAWDYGMVRNALDPGAAFAENILSTAKSTLITSASLRPKRGGDKKHSQEQNKWVEWQSGAQHLPLKALHSDAPSPFNYGQLAKMFVVTDVARHTQAKAEAMAALFCAAGGGGLGLWTSIRRLSHAHDIIAQKLTAQGLRLLSQHQDRLSLAALIDIFRDDEDACLLGTDALRDGIDVPGRALRLLVFERMPWGRPDILYKRRRALFPTGFYDEMIVSLRLQQAFGRLIRKKDDRGIFVLLDGAFPSRLEMIFPKGMEIERVKLKHAVSEVKKFYDKG